MNSFKVYQIDTFSQQMFHGNAAAVCPLDAWLADDMMQNIAMENNLSETAFFVGNNGVYDIRWFTPTVEVDLCGHATLASAFILFTELGCKQDVITFSSKSGNLEVQKMDDGKIELDFPNQKPAPCATPQPIQQAFGDAVLHCLQSEDYVVVLRDEAVVRMANPDLALLRQLDLRGVIITAQAKDYDFVSRFFAPNCGIDEDPVTGSAFTQLAPYWAEMLGTNKLTAKQVSTRGGEVWCEVVDKRVKIAGYAVKYLEGQLTLSNNA